MSDCIKRLGFIKIALTLFFKTLKAREKKKTKRKNVFRKARGEDFYGVFQEKEFLSFDTWS